MGVDGGNLTNKRSAIVDLATRGATGSRGNTDGGQVTDAQREALQILRMWTTCALCDKPLLPPPHEVVLQKRTTMKEDVAASSTEEATSLESMLSATISQPSPIVADRNRGRLHHKECVIQFLLMKRTDDAASPLYHLKEAYPQWKKLKDFTAEIQLTRCHRLVKKDEATAKVMFAIVCPLSGVKVPSTVGLDEAGGSSSTASTGSILAAEFVVFAECGHVMTERHCLETCEQHQQQTSATAARCPIGGCDQGYSVVRLCRMTPSSGTTFFGQSSEQQVGKKRPRATEDE